MERGEERVTVSVLSALRYWSETGTQELPGVLKHSFELPARGVVVTECDSPNRSLLWVDGLVTQARATQDFISSLRQGELPAPLATTSPLPGRLRVASLSPESLRDHPQSMLSVIGRSGALLSAAQESSETRCVTCGGTAPLFKHPALLSTRIQKDANGKHISLSFEGEPDVLEDWAQQLGFQGRVLPSGKISIRIDSGIATESLPTRILPPLRSAWRKQSLQVVVQFDGGAFRYAPAGICAQCGTPAPRREYARLSHLIEKGLDPTTQAVSESAIVVAGLSLAELLATPVDALPHTDMIDELLPVETRRVLARVGLGHLTLGQPSSSLSSSEIAMLSCLASLMVRGGSGVAVIDVPHGLFEEKAAQELASVAESFSEMAPSIFLGRAPWQPGHVVSRLTSGYPSQGTLASMTIPGYARAPAVEFPIFRGPCILPSREAQEKIFQTIRMARWDANTILKSLQIQSEEKPSLSFAPIFETLSTTRLLIEELGLYEAFSRLCASSVDAKAHGITARDLGLRKRAGADFTCPECRGVGLLLKQEHLNPRPSAHPCSACDGRRFRPPVATLLFRGRTPAQMLNSPISLEEDLLHALPGSRLPLELVRHLGLSHLPPGMPLALLSFSERRRLQILRAALTGSSRRPTIAFLEHPFAGLSESHAHAVQSLLETPSLAPNTAWLFAL